MRTGIGFTIFKRFRGIYEGYSSIDIWILTPTGVPIVDKKYIWVDNKLWNDSYFWTEE